MAPQSPLAPPSSPPPPASPAPGGAPASVPSHPASVGDSAPIEGGDTGGQATPVKEKEIVTAPDGETYEITASGKTHKFTLDELKRRAALGIGAENTFREKTELKKQLEVATAKQAEYDALVEMLRSNPRELLQQAGHDPRQFSEQILSEFLAEQQTPVEVRELNRVQAELDGMRKKEQERSLTEQRAAYEQQLKQTTDALVAETLPLLEKDPLLAAPELRGRLVDEVGQILHGAYLEGTPLTVEQAVAFVRADRIKQQVMMLENLADEKILDTFGEKFMARVRKADMARLRAAAIPNAPTGSVRPIPPAVKERPTISEYLQRG